jgi:hypothetical protein
MPRFRETLLVALLLLASPCGVAAGAAEEARTLRWRDLMPLSWDPALYLRGFEIDRSWEDGDPRAVAALDALREKAAKAPPVRNLHGRQVRLPGFVVALEADGKGVSEFLLVPWQGACIHTPPPPANQIVHVFPERPVAPAVATQVVWVSGIIEVIAGDTALAPTGYRIRDARVSRYDPAAGAYRYR